MQVDIECQPSYAIAYCKLEQGESVYLEKGGLVAMSNGIDVGTSMGSGGIVKAALRKKLGGESFFYGRYTAAVHGAWVAVAPRFPGDISTLWITPDTPLCVRTGALLAHVDGIKLDVEFAGMANIALHEGATMLRASGSGQILVSTYGGLQEFTLQPGENLVVDTGHIVAFSDGMRPQLRLLGGVVVSEITGEGVVGLFEGPGTVWMQTRAEQGLRSWLMPEAETHTGNIKG